MSHAPTAPGTAAPMAAVMPAWPAGGAGRGPMPGAGPSRRYSGRPGP